MFSNGAETLPSRAASTALDPKFGDSIVVLLINFSGILQQKRSHRACQKYISMDFLMKFTRTYKKQRNW